MEERGFPRPNPEDEFKSSVEKEDSKEDKKSKRKKGFDKLLNLLLPKKTEESATEGEDLEEKSRIEKLMEASKSLFGKVLGLDREEIEETSEQADRSLEHQESPISLNLGGIFAATEESEDYSAHDITQEPKVVERDEENKSIRPKSQDEIGQQQDYEDIDITTIHKEVESAYDDIDEYELPNPDHIRTNVENYQPINRSTENEAMDRVDRKENNTIVERGGGAGAALVGFVAAEVLSRSRDKKIRKEAEQLSKRVDKNNKAQEAKEAQLQALQKRQRQEIDDLHRKRKIEAIEIGATKNKIDRRYFNNQENLKHNQKESAKITPEVVNNAVNEKIKTETFMQKPKELRFEKSSVGINERVHLEQIEQAAENDIPIESYYEKRHEAKDVASASVSGMKSGSGLSDDTLYKDIKDLSNSVDHQVSSSNMSQGSSNKLYRDAVKQGATAGLWVIIAVIIIALIWSLL